MGNINKLPCTKSPCANCPFRKDTLDGWLGKERMEEITSSDSFTCHKTSKPRLQCAGHMLLLKEQNQFYRLGKMFYRDRFELQGEELIFNSVEECIEKHTT